MTGMADQLTETFDTQIEEAQTYGSIGELAPEAETADTHQQAWDGIAGNKPPVTPVIDQLQSHDFSRWNTRADRQGLAVTDDDTFAADFFNPVNTPADIPPRAGYAQDQGYTETPTAATRPTPFKQAPDGTTDPADAALETSGNSGTRN